jgi:PPM family protein phosphatase
MDFLFAVSDGMGGAKAGEFASRIAVDQIIRLTPKSFQLAAMGLGGDYANILREIFFGIHREMERMGKAYEECQGMGATLSLIWFSPQWMNFAHVGDSRIYYLPKGGSLRQLSTDHSVAGRLLQEGHLSPREARNHPQKSILEKVLGASHDLPEPQLGAVACEPGDCLILCSDGVSDALFDSAIERFLRQPPPHLRAKSPAERLVQGALFESGRDNLTALVVEVGGT